MAVRQAVSRKVSPRQSLSPQHGEKAVIPRWRLETYRWEVVTFTADRVSGPTDHGNRALSLCSWVPGLALKGHPGTTTESAAC
jgi:hypothetical protein